MYIFIKLKCAEYKNLCLSVLGRYRANILINGNDFFIAYTKEDIKDALRNKMPAIIVGEVDISKIKIRRIKVKEEKNG